ncbi:ABC transporter permease [Metamycoplasma hominis]|uniref:ABC transporter permease n=1 Tax=Metamycoplasma hominis TaxID=2098 RepID=UPI00158A96B5|nr:ABC transporter permease [Metamycoplasma hominis]QKX31643.1 ABC transporter permease [Metamycoplasma hominis]QKX39141.1 ABC transporter permease [Metamycoplasma hominis]
MKTALNNYHNFLFKVTAKKKSTIIIPIILLLCSLILCFVFVGTKPAPRYFNVIIFAYTLVAILFTVLYGSLKSLNIFKDLEQDGIELIIFSKPISRKAIIWGKILSFNSLGLIWTLFAFVSSIIVYSQVSKGNMFGYLVLLSLVAHFLAYTIFGYIAALIAYKVNQKIAITVPIIIFAPMAIGGGFIFANSTSTNENFAHYINSKYKYHRAGNEVNSEVFYLNKNDDKYYLVPNGINNNKFSDVQNQYLNLAWKYSNSSANEWQKYSWLAMPYQFVDIFNIENQNIFSNLSSDSINNSLSNYLYYKNQENTIYKYKLNRNSDLLKLPTLENKIKINKYYVPGMLNLNSNIDNEVNNGVIYARKNASNFSASFEEDNFVYASPNNLVGKLKWKIMSQVLKYHKFTEAAEEFYSKVKNEISLKKLVKPYDIKKLLLETISNEVNNTNSKFFNIDNVNLAVFDPHGVRDGRLQSETERKIYIATALLYFIYFKDNQGQVIKSLLKSESDKTTYAPSQIEIKVDGYIYEIGGYESYEPKQQVQENKITKNKQVVVRYELIPSNKNYLFQTVDDVYSIERDRKIVNKQFYILIWVVVAIILMMANRFLYLRKDYK